MSSSPTTLTEHLPRAPAPDGGALPRLLAGIPARGAMTLRDHLALHGEPPSLHGHGRQRDRARAERLIEEIDRAGLLGRGGGAFPTATKMRAVAAARGRAIAVVNVAEGEPASLKDRTLVEALPHLVIDGGVLAAQAVDADELLLCVCESAGAVMDSVAAAIEERHRSTRFEAFDSFTRVQLSPVPSHYVAGQESALVNYLNGGPAKPLFTPPMPFEQGVKRRPTLISNAETLAHLALIARHGASWFRQLGTPGQPGSALVTLAGPLQHPGVYEIEQGASLASLIDAGGGTTAAVRAALIGGYAGTWIEAERLRGLALSDEHLAPHGASLGAGIVLLLSDAACPVAETARAARWLAGQSAHQCGPCTHGLDALATTLEQIALGSRQPRAIQSLERLAALVQRRGACGHPDGAVNFILSALEAFPAEFAEHARGGPCERCSAPVELPLPARPMPETGRPKGRYRR